MLITPTRRAALAAAAALAIDAGGDPIPLLDRLAAEDRDLRPLARVAADLRRGTDLPTALRRRGILSRDDATALAGADGPALAEALRGIADDAVAPPPGERLIRWWPLVLIGAAGLPWILIAAGVAAVGHAAYAGPVAVLMGETSLEPSRWLVEAGTLAATALVLTALWRAMARVPVLREPTYLSTDAERTGLLVRLLNAPQTAADAAWVRALRRWARLSRAGAEIDPALAAGGGRRDGVLMALGLPALDADGRPDWRRTRAEARADQAAVLARMRPGLVGIIILAGIYGFFTTGLYGEMRSMVDSLDGRGSFLPGSAPLLLVIHTIVITVVATALAWGAGDRSFWRWLAGPAGDWPRFAGLLADGLDRGEAPAAILRRARLRVGVALRRRIDRALAEPIGEPGPHLVAAGVVPRAIAAAVARARGRELAVLCRAVPDPRMPELPWVPVIWWTMITGGVCAYLGGRVLPKLAGIMATIDQHSAALDAVILVLGTGIPWLAAAGAVAGLGAVVAVRAGWWAGAGWGRRARGLVLHQGVLARRPEAEIAARMADLWPRLAAPLARAGAAGRFDRLAAAAGWAAADPPGLARALAAAEDARRRRRAAAGVALRVAAPLVMAVPIGLAAYGLIIPTTRIHSQLAGWERPLPAPGAPIPVLIHWWTRHAERLAEQALERTRGP